jgi:hypothetical protein
MAAAAAATTVRPAGRARPPGLRRERPLARVARMLEDEQQLLRAAGSYRWPEDEDVTCSVAEFSSTDVIAALDHQSD